MKNFFLKVLYWSLKLFAGWVLRARKPKIIAVTGSVAKSSTKEAIYQAISDGRRATSDERRENKRLIVGKSEGNLNNEIGVPLAILGFKKAPHFWQWFYILPWAKLKALYYLLIASRYPQILVLEMAADKPGDIEYLTSFVKPSIAVVTAVGPSHLQTFKTIEKVAEEKEKLVEALPKDGFAVLNQSDPQVAKMARKVASRPRAYPVIPPKVEFYGMANRTKAKVLFFKSTGFDIPEKAARAVGEIFGLSKAQISQALSNLKALKGRMNILRGINGSTILDDSYNSNPLSASAALEYLKAQSAKRRIAVLGDMLELGDYSKKGHQEIGEKAKECADLVLAQGAESKAIAEKSGGRYFKTKQEMIEFLEKELKEDDLVLVKASRGMKFEEIIEKLKVKR